MVASLLPETTNAEPALASLLQATFVAFEAAEIRYCLLRGMDELLSAPQAGDIDLLVDGAQLERARHVLARLGFAYLNRWGQAPHHFFIGYDQAGDHWIKLDIVTAIRYGRPTPVLDTPLANACLERRRRDELCYVLAPEDELLTTLLHCVLDKGAVRPGYQVRLRELLAAVDDEAYLTDRCATMLPPQASWPVLRDLLVRGDWSGLVALEPALIRHLDRDERVSARWRHRGLRALRWLDRRTRTLRTPGFAVTLLAPDGAGKTTLAHTLQSTFYLPASYVYMGTNRQSSTVSLPTTRWLDRAPRWLPRPLLRALRGVNGMAEQALRYRYGAWQRARGRLVVFDRYASSSLTPRPQKAAHKRLQHWINRRLCPPPDLVVLLDAPPEVLYQRKQDHPPQVLAEQRQRFLDLVGKVSNSVIVDAGQAPDEVRREAVARIWRAYVRESA